MQRRSMIRKEERMQRYGQESQDSVEEAMHRRKEGTLRSGRSGKKVKSRKQAIAIGLSEARQKGGRVPPREDSDGGSDNGMSGSESSSSSSSSEGSTGSSRGRRSSSRGGTKA